MTLSVKISKKDEKGPCAVMQLLGINNDFSYVLTSDSIV